jgi:hypothetical protein
LSAGDLGYQIFFHFLKTNKKPLKPQKILNRVPTRTEKLTRFHQNQLPSLPLPPDHVFWTSVPFLEEALEKSHGKASSPLRPRPAGARGGSLGSLLRRCCSACPPPPASRESSWSSYGAGHALSGGHCA